MRQDFNLPSAVAVDQSAPQATARLWRQQRNEQVRMQAQLNLSTFQSKTKFDERICFENDSESRMTSCLCLHPYDTLLIVADERDRIVVWNYASGELIRKFSNQNSRSSRITRMTFVNNHDRPLLLVGSSDGVVRWISTHTRLLNHDLRVCVINFRFFAGICVCVCASAECGVTTMQMRLPRPCW